MLTEKYSSILKMSQEQLKKCLVSEVKCLQKNDMSILQVNFSVSPTHRAVLINFSSVQNDK